MATTPILRKAESQVNTTDAAVGAGGNNTQDDAQIVALGDGGYVIVWTDGSRAYNPAGTAVLGQRYDALGTRVGNEFNISQSVVGDQSLPAVTPLPDGGFLVAFVDSANNGDIYVRRYDVNLNLLRTDTIDNSAATTTEPALTAFADGSYVVAYAAGATEPDIVGRLVSAAGVVGSEFIIYGDAEDWGEAELATLSDGNFVAVFTEDDTQDSVRFRVLEPDGTPVTDALLVGGGAPESSDPDVAALPNGRFVIVSRDNDIFSSDDAAVVTIRENDGSFVTSFNAADGANNDPNVVTLSDGGFLVTWERFFSSDVQGQRYDADGNAVGSEFRVRPGTNSDSTSTAQAALLRDGRIAFAINDVLSGDADIAHSIWGATIDVADLDGVLWQHADGVVATHETELGQAASNWEIAGTGDFDGDGDSDILWHDITGLVGNGRVVTWELENGELVTNHRIASAGTTWDIVGTGDFDNDGDDDILWQNADGRVVTWVMEDGELFTTRNQPSVEAGWAVQATGDFDSDGDSDILWRNSTSGVVVNWEMQDGLYVVNHNLPSASGDWQIRGAGDFDGDGDADILWLNTDGRVVTWEMEDGNLRTNHNLPSVSSGWQIEGVHDFDDDGDADILFRQDSGLVVTWEMEDGAFVTNHNFGVVANTWQVKGTGAFDLG